MIQLGDKVRDRVSGVTGIAVCKSEWFNGCLRWTVQQPASKDGKLPELVSFDVEQLDVLKAGAVKPSKRATGGPMPTPQRI
jgi:hypothetical protein